MTAPLKYSVYIAQVQALKHDAKHPRKQWWNLLNYILNAYEEMGIYYEIECKITEALKIRNFNILDAWRQYPEHHELVLAIQEILSEFWKFEVVFIPEDDYAVIGQILTGDLVEIGIIMSIEKYFGLGEVINDEIIGKNMLGFIQFISNCIDREKNISVKE